jgi:hypothetical protein
MQISEPLLKPVRDAWRIPFMALCKTVVCYEPTWLKIRNSNGRLQFNIIGGIFYGSIYSLVCKCFFVGLCG